MLIGFSTAVFLLGECVNVPETRYCRLEVIATDLTGAPIPEVEIEVTPIGGGRTIKSKGKGTKVLYGDWELRVYAKGFAGRRREVRLYQPEAVVRVDLMVGSIGCADPPAKIEGRVRHNLTSGELWVKAIPVRGIGGGESRLDKSGHFLISGLETTAYLMTVMQDETVLHQEVVKTYGADGIGGSKLDIDLRKQ
jgi:hypothetical protein